VIFLSLVLLIWCSMVVSAWEERVTDNTIFSYADRPPGRMLGRSTTNNGEWVKGRINNDDMISG
jgi:hypothetical protein